MAQLQSLRHNVLFTAEFGSERLVIDRMSSPGPSQLDRTARDAVAQRDAERERLRQRIMNMSLPHRLVYLLGLIRDTRRHFLLYCISVYHCIVQKSTYCTTLFTRCAVFWIY